MTGVKILAGLLVFGLTFSAPATAWAAESGLTEVTSNGSENGEKLQAKSIDGRDTLTEVSDLVLEMIHNEEIRYNEETGYLEDTGLRDAAKTGWKVDPITGDEVEVTVTFPDDYSAADLAGKEAVFDVTVNGIQGQLFLPHNSENAKTITWIDADSNLQFVVKAFCSETDILHMAENVCLVKM